MNQAVQKNLTSWQAIRTASLDISMGNRYQAGDYLESLFIWTSRRFSDCLINLGDTLCRHNIENQHNNPALAYKLTREAGDSWISGALPYFKSLSIPYKIIRSDDWLNHHRFPHIHQLLWDFYEHDDSFCSAVSKDIDGFVFRNQHDNEHAVRKSSLSYLIEETAADIVLAQEQQTTHIYPGAWHGCYFNLMQRAQDIPHELRGLEASSFKRISPGKIAKAANANKNSDDSGLAAVA